MKIMRFSALVLLVAGAYAAGETCTDVDGADTNATCLPGYEYDTTKDAVDVETEVTATNAAGINTKCCKALEFKEITPSYGGTISAGIPNSNYAGKVDYTFAAALDFACVAGFTKASSFTATFATTDPATGAGTLTGAQTDKPLLKEDAICTAAEDGSAADAPKRNCWLAGVDGADALKTLQAAGDDWEKKTVPNEGEYKGGDPNGGCTVKDDDGDCVRVGSSGACPEDGNEYICVRKEYSYKTPNGDYESAYYGGCVAKDGQKMECSEKKIDNIRGTDNQELREVKQNTCYCDTDDCNSLSPAAALMAMVGLALALLH